MTVYRTIAFDQNTMAYHGGDAGWIRHANSENLSRPSLEPDLSDLPMVRAVSTHRFGRRLGLARRAPNVLGDLPLVTPVSTHRFGRRLGLARHAPNVLGQFIDPATIAEIGQAVQAASTIASTAYGLDQQHKATKAQQQAASAAQAQAAAAQTAADAAAAGGAPALSATGTPTVASGTPDGAGGGRGSSSSNILLYAVGGVVGIAVLALLLRRPAAAAK